MATKQELTLEQIKKTLRFYERARIPVLICAAAVTYFLCGLVIASVYLIIRHFAWHFIVFVIATVILLGVPTFILGRRIYDVVRNLKMIDNSDFTIAEDKLVHIAVNEYIFRWYVKPERSYYNAFYFATYDRYELSSRNELMNVSVGDMFYVVKFNRGDERIRLAYSQNIYKYKQGGK